MEYESATKTEHSSNVINGFAKGPVKCVAEPQKGCTGPLGPRIESAEFSLEIFHKYSREVSDYQALVQHVEQITLVGMD